MAGSFKKKFLRLLPLVLIIFEVGVLTVKRVQDHAIAKEAPKQADNTASLTVRCVKAVSGPIQALVFGEGTARAVRREFLTFQHQGKITSALFFNRSSSC